MCLYLIAMEISLIVGNRFKEVQKFLQVFRGLTLAFYFEGHNFVYSKKDLFDFTRHYEKEWNTHLDNIVKFEFTNCAVQGMIQSIN